ncbi:hypothetical protein JOY44_06335 [Phormidium sp. CLA17]|uniref:hypothetical protein n=1 Tax=Leptolyngbya sp. Cla-17 TaxID=2803751 RepID=UPI001490B6A4|nr:hypothetical protein [Leptolyngbya sp. Cla-17]MBM0741239.1 hypothetical protein [Leptolyngbya sp. Cla-17]
MTLTEWVAQIKSVADMIVYVWLGAIAITCLFGKKIHQWGFSLHTLPSLWSPPIEKSINQPYRYLIENAESFLVLGGLLLLRGTRDWVIVTLGALLIDCFNGLLFSKSAKYFGANSILFSYLGFLLLRGYFEGGIIAILMTILVGFICSKMLWGMVPLANSPGWRGHLLSFLGGALMAWGLDAIAPFLPVSQVW